MTLLLPKNYLSYNAWSMWRRNPEQFKKEYFKNQDGIDSKYLRFGKNAAEGRESRDLKEGQFTEYELKTEINGVNFIGYIDFYDSNTHTFEEDKTGKNPWTQAKVQKHEQLTFYAMALKAIKGKMPEYCDLIWKETKDGAEGGLSNDVEFTGKIMTFRRYFDEREIIRLEKQLLESALEVSKAYQDWIGEI